MSNDIIEHHVDLLAGVGAVAWALSVQTVLPQLGELCDPMFAAWFGIVALGRWYRKMRARRIEQGASRPAP